LKFYLGEAGGGGILKHALSRIKRGKQKGKTRQGGEEEKVLVDCVMANLRERHTKAEPSCSATREVAESREKKKKTEENTPLSEGGERNLSAPGWNTIRRGVRLQTTSRGASATLARKKEILSWTAGREKKGKDTKVTYRNEED